MSHYVLPSHQNPQRLSLFYQSDSFSSKSGHTGQFTKSFPTTTCTTTELLKNYFIYTPVST